MTKERRKKKFKIPELVDNRGTTTEAEMIFDSPIVAGGIQIDKSAFLSTPHTVAILKYLLREIMDIKRRLDENVLISKENKPLTDIDRIHIVQKGEKMSVIAKKELANSGRFPEIAALNYDRYPKLRQYPNDPEENWILKLP